MGGIDDTKVGTASPTAERGVELGSIRELRPLHVDGVDPVFEHQAQLVNHAVQVIGMGKVRTVLSWRHRTMLTVVVPMGSFRPVWIRLAL